MNNSFSIKIYSSILFISQCGSEGRFLFHSSLLHLPVADLEKNKGGWLDWDGVNWPVVQWFRELNSKMSL